MQVSASTAAMSSIASQAPADILSMKMLRHAMDASGAQMAQLLEVLPDPDPTKGNGIDTYA